MHSNYFIWSFKYKVVAELEAFQAKVAETEQNSCFWGWGLGLGAGEMLPAAQICTAPGLNH